jgi:hypothetical protein
MVLAQWGWFAVVAVAVVAALGALGVRLLPSHSAKSVTV